MTFVEAVGFVSDVCIVVFAAMVLSAILTGFILTAYRDIKKSQEEEKRVEERAEELDDEIDFIAAKLGYVKKTKDEENENDENI